MPKKINNTSPTPNEDWSVKQIKEYLTVHHIKFSSRELKADLLHKTKLFTSPPPKSPLKTPNAPSPRKRQPSLSSYKMIHPPRSLFTPLKQ